jgi:hypothetical protein
VSRWRPDFTRPVALGLARERIAWMPAGAAEARAGEPLAMLREAAGSSTRRPLEIIAGNDVAVHWMQAVPSAVQSLAELRRVAQLRCSQLFGGAPADWWVAGDWSAQGAFACAALPSNVAQPVDAAARALRRRIRWRTAWGLACERRARAIAHDGWNALRSPSAAMLWHCTGGRADCVVRMGTVAQEPQQELQERVGQQAAMECVRNPRLAPAPVRWHPIPAIPGQAGCEAHAALGWALAGTLGDA